MEGGFALACFDNSSNKEYEYNAETDQVTVLLDGSKHNDDGNWAALGQRVQDESPNQSNYLSQIMLRHVTDYGFKQPTPCK